AGAFIGNNLKALHRWQPLGFPRSVADAWTRCNPWLGGSPRLFRPRGQQGLRGPARGGNALGVAVAAGRARGLLPAAVLLLRLQEESAAAPDRIGEIAPALLPNQGQQYHGGIERLGRGRDIRPPAAALGL